MYLQYHQPEIVDLLDSVYVHTSISICPTLLLTLLL